MKKIPQPKMVSPTIFASKKEKKMELEYFMNLLADKIVERVSEKFSKPEVKADERDGERVLYTVKQVCEMLHISKSKLYRYQKMGYISPSEYVGRTPLYSQQAIDDFLNKFRYNN